MSKTAAESVADGDDILLLTSAGWAGRVEMTHPSGRFHR